jgi:cohesin complex subunit SCC1
LNFFPGLCYFVFLYQRFYWRKCANSISFSFLEKLLFPEVPIALRMSAHLLLGLVRIFAWKVDYTFSDCNRLLTDIRTAIVNIKISLPADANRAPPQSVTLPSNFELDDFDLDDLVDDAE